MSAVTDELPTIRWADAGQALAWAEELVSRPDCPSPTGAVIDALKGRMMRGASDWTYQDYRDLAETVLVCVSSVTDHQGREAFLAVCGAYDEDRRLRVAVDLAKTAQGWPVATRKSYSQLSRVAKVSVLRERSRYEWKKPLARAYYAQALGVTPDELVEAWLPVIRELEQALRERVRRGRVAFEEELAKRGLL